MISVTKLCQHLEELTQSYESLTENVDSFCIKGDLTESVVNTLNNIILLFDKHEINPLFILHIDEEKVEISHFNEYQESNECTYEYDLTFHKKKFIQDLLSGNGDVDEYLFISLDVFNDNNNNKNGLGLNNALMKGAINKSTNTRVHVNHLQASFGGPKLAIVPLDENSIGSSWLEGSKLPTDEALLKQIHLITHESLKISPREFQLTWGDLSTDESMPFKVAYAQHLLISLSSNFYYIDKVSLKGVKHIETSIAATESTNITADWLNVVTECVEWCYSSEDPDVRIQLLIDRLSLEYIEGSLLDLAVRTFKHSFEQARDNYKFVIAKKSDEYRKELKNIYSDIKSVTDKFAEKTSLLSSELLKSLIALCFVFTVGTISKAIVNNQLLHSTEGLFLFKVISVYLVMSFFVKWLNISADLKISYCALNDWSNKLHSHISVNEVKAEIKKQTFWSKVFYYCSLAFVGTIQLFIALSAYFAQSTLFYLEL